MNVKQLLPKEQRELIIKALESYQHTIHLAIERHEANNLGDVLNHDVFDITGLIGMMKYDVEIALPKEHKDTFASRHGVDFPEYCEDVYSEYPIFEIPKDEWVHIVTGDFSFIDDDIHARECHINNIVTIEKHLSKDADVVIDDIENDGHGWMILEDYDGIIEMNFNSTPKVKDERLFQVVDVCGSYTVTNSFKEVIDNGFDGHHDGHYRDAIDKLGAGESLEIHKSEVYIIRIK